MVASYGYLKILVKMLLYVNIHFEILEDHVYGTALATAGVAATAAAAALAAAAATAAACSATSDERGKKQSDVKNCSPVLCLAPSFFFQA